MNIVIIENEIHVAKTLKKYIEEINDSCVIIQICDSIQRTKAFLKENKDKVSLYFMDIELADGNCFDLLRQVKIYEPIVFCTAHRNYIMDAFGSNGIDYILKPFERTDIENALLKIEQIKNAFRVNPEVPGQLPAMLPVKKLNTSYLVKYRDKIYPIHVKDIALISLENDVLYIYTLSKEKYSIFKTIDDMETGLDSRDFFRINRQMIINRNAILEMETVMNRKVSIKLKIPVRDLPIVSRLKVTPFLNWIEKAQ